MSSQRTRALVVALGVVAIGGLAACGSSSTAGDTGTAATDTAATTTSPATDTGATTDTSATTATTAVAKVSANTATAEEITAALEAAGVQNAERWTKEVMEYRPYDEADASLGQLRTELLKYNPSDDQLTRILSVLTP